MIFKRLYLLTVLAVFSVSSVCVSKEVSRHRSLKTAADNTEIIETVRGEQEGLYARSKKRSASKPRSAQKCFVIDKILARVNGANILQSDLELPRIAKEGGLYSLEEIISEELFVQRSIEQHLLPSELDIERQIVAFKMQNQMADISDADFEKQLKQSGFTLKTYKEQLGRLLAVESVKRAEVGEKLMVTSQEVEEYYKKNPEYIKEAYNLKIANIEKIDVPEKEYVWEDLGWVEMADLDKQFSFVPSMKNGEISQLVKVGEAYQVVKVVDKKMPRQKTLKECYRAIEKRLLHGQKEKYLKNVDKEIRVKASIVYL